MSITEKLKLRLCEEVQFNDDGYHAMCRVIDEFAEALKPSHNSSIVISLDDMESVLRACTELNSYVWPVVFNQLKEKSQPHP